LLSCRISSWQKAQSAPFFFSLFLNNELYILSAVVIKVNIYIFHCLCLAFSALELQLLLSVTRGKDPKIATGLQGKKREKEQSNPNNQPSFSPIAATSL
jgi:hypothetical protein